MNAANTEDSLVVITWNGKNKPFNSIFFDAIPSFEILLFNYSGISAQLDDYNVKFDFLIDAKTECKGQIIYEVDKYIDSIIKMSYQYIGFIDDDIIIKISDINFMLHIAKLYKLDAFQPSVYHDSFHSYKYNLNEPSVLLSSINWVEIMAPFFRHDLLKAARSYLNKSISSYGIDCYVIPFYQKILNMNKTAVINAVIIHHYQEITSGDKKYSNGLTASEEAENIRLALLRIINEQYPHLLKDRKFMAEILKYNVGIIYKLQRGLGRINLLLSKLVLEFKIRYRRFK